MAIESVLHLAISNIGLHKYEVLRVILKLQRVILLFRTLGDDIEVFLYASV